MFTLLLRTLFVLANVRSVVTICVCVEVDCLNGDHALQYIQGSGR
jgi:hypothetical protein